MFSALLSRWNNIHIHHLGHMNVRLLYDNLVAESEILNKFANNTAPIPNLGTHGLCIIILKCCPEGRVGLKPYCEPLAFPSRLLLENGRSSDRAFLREYSSI